jgi:hypothetical protein
MGSKVYSWRKKRKTTNEIRNEMKKVAQSSNTGIRDISQVFGANLDRIFLT